ncbi:MAG: hypothetical protein OJF49_001318 [Ktedonobacterales bacterium]|jgi:uncharacterized protein (DUF433 family)|nr:MAG: hypothetical protein OJF49_001318 [Ktedonobacterales bacterium]
MGTTIIRRPDKGLTITGTRVTLYALMDYLRAGWTADDIRAWLDLTDEQLRVALDYIAAHRGAVEAEYAAVLSEAQEHEQYWEKRLREHLARKGRPVPAPGKVALYAKLAEQRARTIRELAGEPTDVIDDVPQS